MLTASSIPWSRGSWRKRGVLHFLVRVISINTFSKRFLGLVWFSSFDREFSPVRLTMRAGSKCFFTRTMIGWFSMEFCACFIIDILLVSLGNGYYSSSSIFILGIAIRGTIRFNYGSNIGKCTRIVELWGDGSSSDLAQVARVLEVRLVIRNCLFSGRFLSWRWSPWSSRVWCLKIHCIITLAQYVLNAALLQCSIASFYVLRTEWFLSSKLHGVDIEMALCFMHLKSGCCSLGVLHVNLVDITLSMVCINNLAIDNRYVVTLRNQLAVGDRHSWRSFSCFFRWNAY